MRPHTRTQCTDGKDCSACNSGLPSGGGGGLDNDAPGSSKSGHPHALGPSPLNNHNFGTAHGANCSNVSPFVAPTSGPLRRSITNAAKSQTC